MSAYAYIEIMGNFIPLELEGQYCERKLGKAHSCANLRDRLPNRANTTRIPRLPCRDCPTNYGWISEYELSVAAIRPVSIGSEGFLSYIHTNLIEGKGHEYLGAELTQQFWRFVRNEAHLLDEIETAPCLVHSDYGGSNILIHQTENGWVTSGILDWEFAYSGSSLADIGHILRSPFGSMEQFERHLIDGFVTNGGILPVEWKRMSKLFDLLAWVDFLNRPTSGSIVINSARSVILYTMNNWSRF